MLVKQTGNADLQNNAAVIVGRGSAPGDLPKLGKQHMDMSIDGAEVGRVSTGPTTETVLRSLAWLANHAAERGLPLKRGEVIITGARIGALGLHGNTVAVHANGLDQVSAIFQ